MSRQTPLYVFDDPAEFYRRHSNGVLQEFNNEKKEIDRFNKKEMKFSAWIVAELYRAQGCTHWLFFVRCDGADYLFPREGETCELTLWSRKGDVKRWENAWEAERVENPAATLGIPDGPVHRLPAFKVKVPQNVPPIKRDDHLRPMEEDPDLVGTGAPSHLMGKYAFSEKKAYRVTLVLRISSATKDAEIGALNKLHKNPDVLTDKQKAAYQYLMNFKHTPFTVNLFNHFPHLCDPLNNPGKMPIKVITMLKGFNEHQRSAYRNVLGSIPSGVCIIPGGPGAGKTHWNLVVTAAIQSKNVRREGGERAGKVLYILDINKPLDDTCNKIVKLYKSLGLKRYAVRLHGWHYGHNKAIPDFSQKFLFIARMNRYRRQNLNNENCLAPSLDQLALNIYEESQDTRYRELRDSIRGGRSERLTALINQLYKDVLAQVDFIATTPVPAATGFNGLFKPDLVIFDESPHAREASTMVAIAEYDPIAWIFSGDHRQTRPFIASDDVRDNPWAPQMLVSMMERADRAGAIKHSLLINHRAYGGLEKLASEMFYAKKMISGHQPSELAPPSVRHIQRYLERFLPHGQKCMQPRLIVCNSRRGEQRVGTSWYNPHHIDFVMARICELLNDTMFRQVGKDERGTILIISPYKESYLRYKRAIKTLPDTWQTRCEARTIDTCQGGEADFVFLDMVRSEVTDFTDDPNRLNVAITRARQAEIILMHPGMRRSARFLAGIFTHCNEMGQVVDISDGARGQPRELAPLPNEKQAYDEHVRYQAQFDQERVARGLEPIATEDETQTFADVVDEQSDESEVDDGPPSIFAERFAKMAEFMTGILNDNKTDRDVKQSQGQAQTQSKANGYGQTQGTATQGKPSLSCQTAIKNTAQMNGNASSTPRMQPQTQGTATQGKPQLNGQIAVKDTAQINGNGSSAPRMQPQDQSAQRDNAVPLGACFAAGMEAGPNVNSVFIVEDPVMPLTDRMFRLDINSKHASPEAAVLTLATHASTSPAQAHNTAPFKTSESAQTSETRGTSPPAGLSQSRWNSASSEAPGGYRVARARPEALQEAFSNSGVPKFATKNSTANGVHLVIGGFNAQHGHAPPVQPAARPNGAPQGMSLNTDNRGVLPAPPPTSAGANGGTRRGAAQTETDLPCGSTWM